MAFAVICWSCLRPSLAAKTNTSKSGLERSGDQDQASRPTSLHRSSPRQFVEAVPAAPPMQSLLSPCQSPLLSTFWSSKAHTGRYSGNAEQIFCLHAINRYFRAYTRFVFFFTYTNELHRACERIVNGAENRAERAEIRVRGADIPENAWTSKASTGIQYVEFKSCPSPNYALLLPNVLHPSSKTSSKSV